MPAKVNMVFNVKKDNNSMVINPQKNKNINMVAGVKKSDVKNSKMDLFNLSTAKKGCSSCGGG